MRTGDIKAVARQNFIITKADVVALWETSKKENSWDQNTIEKDIKVHLDYENKLKSLEGESTKYRSELAQKTQPRSPLVSKLSEKLKSHLLENHSLAVWELDKNEGFYIDTANSIVVGKTPYEKLRESVYECVRFHESGIEIFKDIEFEKATWETQLEKTKELESILNEIEKHIGQERGNIKRLNKEIEALNKEVRSGVEETVLFIKNKAKIYFQSNLKKEIVASFKTNLSGEALVPIRKGNYFVFGIVELAENKIIWNLPIIINKKDQYLELSNDNMSSIYSDDTLFGELMEVFTDFPYVQ